MCGLPANLRRYRSILHIFIYGLLYGTYDMKLCCALPEMLATHANPRHNRPELKCRALCSADAGMCSPNSRGIVISTLLSMYESAVTFHRWLEALISTLPPNRKSRRNSATLPRDPTNAHARTHTIRKCKIAMMAEAHTYTRARTATRADYLQLALSFVKDGINS